jgi:hypothetical protein
MLQSYIHLFYLIGSSLSLFILAKNADSSVAWESYHALSSSERRFLRGKRPLSLVTQAIDKIEHKLQSVSHTDNPIESILLESSDEILGANNQTSVGSSTNLDQNNSTNTDLSPSEKEIIEEFLEKEEQLIKEKEEIVAEEVGGISILLGIAFMIFTAYQMSENPDGVCASLCRLTFTVAGCIVKMILWPFKKICGHKFSGYAHHLVATQDYGETTMGLFQIT